VRTITCTQNGDRHELRFIYYPDTLPDPQLERAIELVTETDLPYRTAWVERLHLGKIDAYFSLLFTKLPRLQYLHLDQYAFTESELLDTVFRPLLCSVDGTSNKLALPLCTQPGSLHNLHRVNLSHFGRDFDRGIQRNNADRCSFNTDDACVLPFFRLPLLQEVSLEIDTPYGISPSSWVDYLPSAPCTNLRKSTLEGLGRCSP